LFVSAITTVKADASRLSEYKKGRMTSSPVHVQKSGFVPSFLGKSKVYSDQIEALKIDLKAYPNDIEYRKQLMTNAGMNTSEYYKLRSIIGKDEMKSIMADFNEHEEFYSVGVNDENIINKKIRANLHIHTVASDGYLTTRELLDKAAVYADEVAAQNPSFKKEPFIIAITDHDATESTKEAIEIIAKDPLKYKNLRVILGAEITTYNDIVTKSAKYAKDAHILAYGIDPNEKTFDNFIESTKQGKNKIAEKMINQANNTYKKALNKQNNLFSLEEAHDFYNPLKKNIIGIYNYMERYLETKFALEDVILKNPTLVEKLKQNNLPTNSNGLMKQIKEFYFNIDHNNSPRDLMQTIPTTLAKPLKMEKETIENIIRVGLQSDSLAAFSNNLKTDLEQYKRTINPKYNYMPTMGTLFDALKNQDSAVIGIAHPLDTVRTIKTPKEKGEFLVDLYRQFKQTCKEKAVFSEVYYQSYSEESKKLKDSDKVKALLNALSKKLKLFKTGSADSHRTNIFKRLF